MKAITQFDCIQNEIYSNGSVKIITDGIADIKTELLRPQLKLNWIFDNEKTIFSKELSTWTSYLGPRFSKKEFLFLKNTYDFELEEFKDNLYSKLSINPLYTSPGTIEFIEYQDKEYLIIKFTRWQHDYQPRGAGEDQLGEDITYIHGIWEDPLLTDEVIKKIKA